ncbi:MAG: hypothetical protein ONB14_12380 [candidate division KSB1 bacterium]|nr:hypothetical protein [candidate division KSB1 bacterium]
MGVDVKKRKRRVGPLPGTAMLTIALIGTAAGLGQKALSQETPTEDIPGWLSQRLRIDQEILDSAPLEPGKRAAIEAEMAQLLAAWRQSLVQPRPTMNPEKAAPGPLPPVETAPPEFDLPRQAAGAGTIIETGQAPFSPMQYLVRNRWVQERPDGSLVLVYAGVQGSALDLSGQQGVVVVVVLGPGGNPIAGESGSYPTPAKAGPVQVTDATGEVLKLMAENGTPFAFDLASRTYQGWPASSPGLFNAEPTPEASPAASPTRPPTQPLPWHSPAPAAKQ